jgi:pimeloyl-ACP methyl ester carboxylesterase
MKKAIFDHKEIAYQVSGQGNCLLLVHGFPMDHRVWDDFSRNLSTHFKVICPDLPGFGASHMMAESHSMNLMARAVKAVLDEEKVGRCVFVGHSMGGYVGLAFAKQFPQMLSGLVLFHSQAAADDEQALIRRNEAIVQVITDKDNFLDQFLPGLFDQAYLSTHYTEMAALDKIVRDQSEKAIIAALSGMRDRESHINLLTKISRPVLFVLGKSDTRMPAVKIMAQAGLPQHAELLMLEHIGHMGFAEAPMVTRLSIQHFAEKCFILPII